jgi:hypothetical protein
MDALDTLRKELAEDNNNNPQDREALEKVYGKHDVFDTKQLAAKYEVLGFAAPFVTVREKATGQKGTFEFQHMPRFYFGYMPD